MLRLPRLALVTTLVSSLILTFALAGAVMAGGKPLVATLTPGAEPNPPGGDPSADAGGTFSMTANYGHRTVCYTLTWDDLSEPAAAAHIHVGPVGVAGPVVIGLGVTGTTTGSTSDCIEEVDGELLKAIIQNPSAYYVNVHTSLNPGGAIRGQLVEPD